MKNKKISQSFLKNYNDYKGKKLCGLKFKAQHFDNLEFPTTLPMDLGNYFEYVATGCLPRNGVKPEPKISCIIDLKYSGLIDDKWAETGWDVESLHYKERLLVQAIQYKMLVKENYGLNYDEFDFLFMVFSSKEVHNVKFIRINIDEDAYRVHENHISSIFKQINAMNIEKDFIPYPSIKSCSKCPLYDTCKYKSDIPLIENVYYGG